MTGEPVFSTGSPSCPDQKFLNRPKPTDHRGRTSGPPLRMRPAGNHGDVVNAFAPRPNRAENVTEPPKSGVRQVNPFFATPGEALRSGMDSPSLRKSIAYAERSRPCWPRSKLMPRNAGSSFVISAKTASAVWGRSAPSSACPSRAIASTAGSACPGGGNAL